MEISQVPRGNCYCKDHKDHINVGGFLNWAERSIHTWFDKLLQALIVVIQYILYNMVVETAITVTLVIFNRLSPAVERIIF